MRLDEWGGTNKDGSVCITVVYTIVTWLTTSVFVCASFEVTAAETQNISFKKQNLGAEVLQAAPARS